MAMSKVKLGKDVEFRDVFNVGKKNTMMQQSRTFLPHRTF
jgi:hypothetical protein